MGADEKLTPEELSWRDAVKAFGATVRTSAGAERHVSGLDHLTIVVTNRQVFVEGDNDANCWINPPDNCDQLQAELRIVVKVDDIRRDPRHQCREPIDQHAR